MPFFPPYLQTLRENLSEQKASEDSLAILQEYFQCFSLDEAKEELWQLLAGTLTSEEAPIKTAIDRSNIIFFFEFTKLLIEAGHTLKQLLTQPPTINHKLQTPNSKQLT